MNPATKTLQEIKEANSFEKRVDRAMGYVKLKNDASAELSAGGENE